eukprot:162595-Prymnesium_polylepis.1
MGDVGGGGVGAIRDDQCARRSFGIARAGGNGRSGSSLVAVGRTALVSGQQVEQCRPRLVAVQSLNEGVLRRRLRVPVELAELALLQLGASGLRRVSYDLLDERSPRFGCGQGLDERLLRRRARALEQFAERQVVAKSQHMFSSHVRRRGHFTPPTSSHPEILRTFIDTTGTQEGRCPIGTGRHESPDQRHASSTHASKMDIQVESVMRVGVACVTWSRLT